MMLVSCLSNSKWFCLLRRLNESAQSGYCLADDQVLHLIRAFVGIKRFRVIKETPDVVLGGDAVAAQQLTRPRNCLAALGGGECLGQRGVRVSQLAFRLQLGRANYHAL